MSDDLNDFLRQAAQRREARKKAGGSPPAPGKPSSNAGQNPVQKRSVTSAEELEAFQPIPIDQRHLTPHIPPGDHLPSNVAKADQKREAHLRETFGHTPVPLERQQNKKAKQKSQQKALVPTIATQSIGGTVTSDPVSAPDSGNVSPGNYKVMSPQDLLKLLRNPDSLKMAFIASEIFGRKFQ